MNADNNEYLDLVSHYHLKNRLLDLLLSSSVIFCLRFFILSTPSPIPPYNGSYNRNDNDSKLKYEQAQLPWLYVRKKSRLHALLKYFGLKTYWNEYQMNNNGNTSSNTDTTHVTIIIMHHCRAITSNNFVFHPLIQTITQNHPTNCPLRNIMQECGVLNRRILCI